ncbi:hypothetical protein PV797_04180 [Clostridiaceae bacterium M8S5]|nr:hypothetical protein PV797_04180 [Clostridiaceae bacterium M8S5]
MYCQRVVNDFLVECIVVKMGKDISISLYGGHVAHIGCIVLTIPRESLTGNGISVTTSVINKLAHKDEEIAKLVSEKIARRFDCTVSCSCGVHVDGIDSECIAKIYDACNEIIEDIIIELQK